MIVNEQSLADDCDGCEDGVICPVSRSSKEQGFL